MISVQSQLQDKVNSCILPDDYVVIETMVMIAMFRMSDDMRQESLCSSMRMSTKTLNMNNSTGIQVFSTIHADSSPMFDVFINGQWVKSPDDLYDTIELVTDLMYARIYGY